MRVLHLLTSGSPGGIEVLCQNISYHSDWENYFCFVTDGGLIYEQMKNDGNKVFLLSNIKSIFQKYKKIKKIISDNNIDIINIHHGDIYLELYYILLSLKFKNVKFVSTYHSCFDTIFFKDDGFIKKKLKYLFIQLRFNVSDMCIFVSNAGYLTHKRKFKLNDNKCRIIYNGIVIKKNDNVPVKDNNLLYIGRIIDYKGIDVLLKAINHLVDEKIKVHLDIVGDGPDMNKTKKYIEDNKLSEYVTLYGFDTEKEKYYIKNKLFIYPSICEEVFGISVVEAMSYGLPCITFNKGGIPEIINDGIDGFIVQNDTEIHLAEKIKELLELDYQKILSISQEAKERASEFSLEVMINNLKELYSNLIK